MAATKLKLQMHATEVDEVQQALQGALARSIPAEELARDPAQRAMSGEGRGGYSRSLNLCFGP